MSRLFTRLKEQLVAACSSIESQSEPIALGYGHDSHGSDSHSSDSHSSDSHDSDSHDSDSHDSDSHDSDREAFSLECLLRVVKIQDKAELVSRVNYYFPQEIAISARTALHCAERLNALLIHSRVYVVQNIDGDCRFSLRMDTLLKDAHSADNIGKFLEQITSDVAILLEYFADYLPTIASSRAALKRSYALPFGSSSESSASSSLRAVPALNNSAERFRHRA
jgi:hypothetical protein